MPDGFSPQEGLWRLLRARGQGGSRQAFQETHGPLASAEAMCAPLMAAGLHPRVARVQAADLPHLTTPALLQLPDGSWTLVRGRTRRGLHLETPAGRTRQPFQAIAHAGQALELSPPLGDGSLWRRLFRLLAAHRRALTQIALASLLLQALGLAAPLITGLVLNRALPDGARSLLNLVAAGILLVAGGQAWTSWYRGRLLQFLVNRTEAAATRGFLDHVLRLPFAHLQGVRTGDLLQAFGALGAARELLLEKTLATLLDGGMALLHLAAMTWLLPGPALAVLLTTLVIAAVTVVVGRLEARLQTRAVAHQARERGYLSELLAGIGTLKAAGAEEACQHRWYGHFQAGLRLALRQGRLRLGTDSVLALLHQGTAVLLLIWGGRLVLEGTLSLGTLFAFLTLGGGFTAAVMAAVDTYLVLIVLAPQLEKTQTLLNQPTEPPLPHGPAPTQAPALLLENVWFRYTPEGPWVLAGLDLRIQPGEKHVLEGASGSGKTTLLRLLAGLLSPEKGQIRIDGQSPLQARQRLLYLPQFIQILGGTLLENLRLLSAGASQEDLLRAARDSGLEAFVATLPMGYQTLLPHGGGCLSGGQRQLIAVTAALASGRGLLLLDEAMANLDPLRAAHLTSALGSAPWTLVSASHTPLRFT